MVCVHLGPSWPLSLPQQEVPTLNATWVGGGRDAVGALDGRYRALGTSVPHVVQPPSQRQTLDHLQNASSYVGVLTHPNVAKHNCGLVPHDRQAKNPRPANLVAARG